MPAAASSSSRGRRGTSDTTTKTDAGTEGQSTPRATGPRRRTGRNAGAGSPDAPATGDVTAAIVRDLKAIAKVDADLARSGLAASAVALARKIDDPGTSATAVSMCARSLLDTLDRIRDLMPDEEEGDGLDDLTARRAARVARSSASPA